MKNFTSLSEIRESIHSGSTSCQSLVDYYLERIDKHKDLNIYIEVFTDEAISRAKKVDEKIKNKQETICANGASFEVKNLFYNVPARRNFLKSDAIELGHIQTEFERVALAHPEIHFHFQHNGQEIYNLSSANLRMRLASILRI